MARKKYSTRSHLQAARDEVARDYNRFYSFLDITRGITSRKDEFVLMGERRVAYRQMEGIAQKYPHDNTLRNKLDEAERALWLHGRQ